MSELLRLITLQDANTRVVLLGTTLLGVAAALIGSFAVLRKRSLMGDAVAHAALPGVCAAYFIVGEKNFGAFLVGALVFGLLAALFVAGVKAFTRVKEDAAIAIAIGGFFGLGIVMSHIIQNEPSGNRAGLDGFVFGKAASMMRSDAQLIALVAGAVLACTLLLYKEFKLLCFDRSFAAGLGWPTFALDLVLMALICICTVVGLPAVGVVLVVALLVIPAVAARFWTNRLSTMLFIAACMGGASGLVGTVLSSVVPAPAGATSRGWPTGPVIVLVASSMFIFSLLFAPKRGLIADVVRRASLRRRIALHHVLRDVYEALEAKHELEKAQGKELIHELGAVWTPSQVCRDGALSRSTLRRACSLGLVAESTGGYILTSEGQAEAARIVRAHRLWELYLIEQADIAADHVDRDADQIEHVLPAHVIVQLEARLAEQGRLPAAGSSSQIVLPAVPASPHPLAASRKSSTLSFVLLGTLTIATMASASFASAPSLSATAAAAASATASATASWHITADDWWTIATASVCSVTCGVLGCFLVLRRMALLGDAISHAILPGLALAFIVTGTRDPWAMLVGAMGVGVLTALLSAGLARWGKVSEDAAMGVVFTTLFALGVVLISFVARQVDLDPGCVLYGLLESVAFDTRSVLGVHMPAAFIELSLVMLVVISLIVIFFKELRIVSFDPALATSMGISAAVVHYGLMTAVAATSVASFEAVGSILVIAMLVAPGASAQLLTDKLSRMLWIAGFLSLISACGGYALAVKFDTSIAGMIASVSLAMFVLIACLAPRYGAIARLRSPKVVPEKHEPA
jgi:manganese/zinc/iron transport system permease protein